jgi:mannitol operon repressor
MAAQDYDDVVVDARGRYTTAAVALIMNLTNRPAYVSRKRRKPEDWPI